MLRTIGIAGRKVGHGQPCLVIAEAGVNHNGSIDAALQLVDVAADAGADAVKFQTFRASRLATRDAPKAAYQQQTTGNAETQFEMLQRLELSPEDHRRIIDRCRHHGLLFLSTPFDEECADLLDQLGVELFKIPSGEITNLPFLAHVARKQKPLIVSTGMSTLAEVEAAVNTLEQAGQRDFILLHCVSNYPADPASVNLRAMLSLQAAFQTPVGYSDHTLGTDIATAAVALGACVVEKHFTLDRTLPGPDHQASLEPSELQTLVASIRRVEAALGDGRKRPVASEADTADVARKSLVAATDIPAGAVLTRQHIAVKRPGTGLPPAMCEHLLHRQARQHIPAGTLLKLDMVA